jgi:hypothetical protein
MAWCVAIDYDVRPSFTFEDGSDPESLNGLKGEPAIADPSKLPTSARSKSPDEITTDIVSAGTQTTGYWGAIVSRNLRDAIETVEPGVHEFFPMVLKRQNGTVFLGEFYLLNMRRVFPCILFRESKNRYLGSVKVEPNLGQPYYFCQERGLALSKPAIAGHHLFSTYVVAGGICIMSDVLMEECQRRKVAGLAAFQASELDKPWVPEVEVPELLKWLETRPEQAERLQRLFVGIRS